MWPFRKRPPRCDATTYGHYTMYTRHGVRLPQGEVMMRCRLRGPHERHYCEHLGTGATWMQG